MSKNPKRLLAILLAGVMTVGTLAGCLNENDDKTETSSAGTTTTAETTTAIATVAPKETEELGTGTVKWSETETADGWTLVTNEGGTTLGYSKDSGVKLIQDDGFAFKDLNRNDLLDAYEDWRLDANARAADLAKQLPEKILLGLMLHESVFGYSEDGTDAVTGLGNSMGRTFSGCIDDGVRSALNFVTSLPVAPMIKWNNSAQKYAESLEFGVPVNISTNPANLGANYASNLALGAAMNTELVQNIAEQQAKEFRAVGITTLLGPQIDLAVEPRWSRVSGTYGEDPALSADMTNAYISGLQSTYDTSGNDLGWGSDSVAGMMKHFPGDGAGEGGRESHSASGKFNVYPGDAFETDLIPFVDGGLSLDSKTGESEAVMTSYSIAYSDDGSLGELVGSGYSEYKIKVLRERYNYDGLIVTDWGVTEDLGGMIATPWGVEDKTEPERQYLAIKAGVDQLGGSSDPLLDEAYQMLKDDLGEEAALARIRESARRITRGFFKVGLFDNPYVDSAKANEVIGSQYAQELAAQSQAESVVMLKNDDVIKANDGTKPTVYVPMKYSAGGGGFMGPAIPAGWSLPVDEAILSEYFNFVTDTIGEPTGTGADGNPSFTENDIIRATKDELASVDYALVFVANPSSASGMMGGGTGEDGSYIPLSLQYGEYTANSESVRKESIAGDNITVEESSVYGTIKKNEKENRSYYGKSTVATNKSDLDLILDTTANVSDSAKVIVSVDATNAMVFSEFENKVDAILMSFAVDKKAILDIVSGKVEPSGLLPMQQPKDMEAVEAQKEDVPRDMTCYVDSAGNTYDFAFGLNWSGVINDARTAKYSAAAKTKPNK
jgi:beta-glucosidase